MIWTLRFFINRTLIKIFVQKSRLYPLSLTENRLLRLCLLSSCPENLLTWFPLLAHSLSASPARSLSLSRLLSHCLSLPFACFVFLGRSVYLSLARSVSLARSLYLSLARSMSVTRIRSRRALPSSEWRIALTCFSFCSAYRGSACSESWMHPSFPCSEHDALTRLRVQF